MTGPTASGKTPLAIELALRFGGRDRERRLDAGVPVHGHRHRQAVAAERARVPHHLIDVVTPDQRYSAGRYARDARAAIAAIHARGRVPLLTGGTGLYIRAALHGLIDGVEADEELREQLEAEQRSAERAGDAGPAVPAPRARAIPRRRRGSIPTTRGGSCARSRSPPRPAGRPATCAARTASRTRRTACSTWRSRPEREELYARIDRRCQAMIEGGLLQEVRELVAAGYGPELRPMRAIGYRHVVPVMQGGDTLANALEAMRRDTRHFARRQLTWLRRVPDAVWLDPSHGAAIAELVDAFLAADGVRASAQTRAAP